MTPLKRHTWWAVAAVLVLAFFLTGESPRATNMGFRMNRGIAPLGPFPIGQNWVALPYTNIYTNAQDICNALGLAPGFGAVRQIAADTGVTFSHVCGNAGPYALLTGRCVIVLNNVATNGILAGSHPAAGVATPGFTLFPLAPPPPRGMNLYPVPYNSAACSAQDLCVQLALPATATVRRLNAFTGVTQSHTCGGAGAFPLILGECVSITFPGGGPIPGINPPHF